MTVNVQHGQHMNPSQTHAAGISRKIVDFHLDESFDRVRVIHRAVIVAGI
jgi:hypothetical protein